MKRALRIGLLIVGLLVALAIWRSGGETPAASPAPMPESAQGAAATEPATRFAPVTAAHSREEAARVPVEAPVRRTNDSAPLLRVHVLSKEDRSPRAGVQLALRDAASDRDASWTHIEGMHARLGESPATDAAGWAEFETASGPIYRLSSLGAENELVSVEVAPLVAGERREVEVLLRTQDDVILFGVLIDGESSKALPGGTLLVEEGSGLVLGDRLAAQSDGSAIAQATKAHSVPAEPDGRFELRGRSWTRRFVEATAPGYSRTVFALAVGHADSTQPLEVRLWRTASADVLVKDAAGGPIADALVELSTKGYLLTQDSSLMDFHMGADPRWASRTDAAGKALFTELAPRVPLELRSRAHETEFRPEAEPVVLAPGERRTLVIRWGAGGVIQGQVQDEKGAPLASRKIWRVVNGWTEAALPVVFRGYEKPAGTTQTDEGGRFRFVDVPIGQWSVGLAPPERQKRETSEFPAYAETVEVKTADAFVELTLRVQANLYLRGTVIDPDGKPLQRCNVSASQEGSHMYINGNSDAAGAFALGPLPTGTWTVDAYGFGTGFAPALSVTCEAGSESIVLQMRVGASISGRLVSGIPGEAIECEMAIANIDSAFAGWSMTSSLGDRFEFKGLLAGTYVVSARDRAGRAGSTPAIHLESGQHEDSREIQLAPGAKLQLRYKGPNKYSSCTLLSGGLPIGLEQIYPGKSAEITVPAGSIEIQFGATGTPKSISVVVAAGEVKEVVIDDKP